MERLSQGCTACLYQMWLCHTPITSAFVRCAPAGHTGTTGTSQDLKPFHHLAPSFPPQGEPELGSNAPSLLHGHGGDGLPAQGQGQHQAAPRDRHVDVQAEVLQADSERVSPWTRLCISPAPALHTPLTAFRSSRLRMDPSRRLMNTWIITASLTVALLFSKRMSGFPNNSILMLRGEFTEQTEHCGEGAHGGGCPAPSWAAEHQLLPPAPCMLCAMRMRSKGPEAAPWHTQVQRVGGLRPSKAYTSTHTNQSHSPQRERGSGWHLAAAWHLRTAGREVHTAQVGVSGFQHCRPLCPVPLLPDGLSMFLGTVPSPQPHTHLCYSNATAPSPLQPSPAPRHCQSLMQLAPPAAGGDAAWRLSASLHVQIPNISPWKHKWEVQKTCAPRELHCLYEAQCQQSLAPCSGTRSFSLSRTEGGWARIASPFPWHEHGTAALTVSGVQVNVCGWTWIRRDRMALRKLWRSPRTSSLSSSGGKAEADESWGMMLPPTCCTAPCRGSTNVKC